MHSKWEPKLEEIVTWKRVQRVIIRKDVALLNTAIMTNIKHDLNIEC